jgi:hypothetical protein
MLQGVAKCYAQKLGTKNVIAFFPRKTQKRIIYVWHGSCSIYRYKKERMRMVYIEDIQNELVRLYGENAKTFEIVPIGSAFLVGQTVYDAVEISGWEDFDLLETF